MAKRYRQKCLGKLSSNVWPDFIDQWGIRNTSFQLLDGTNRHAVATVHIWNGSVIRFLSVPILDSHRKAITRLALQQMCKSTPADYIK